MTTIIIGAGASGLACAIRLKKAVPKHNVMLLERLNQIGRKLLATGNGRCNLSNINAENHNDVISFFKDIGLIVKADSDGRIYPYSNMAATVTDILLSECERLGVKIITDCEVCEIDKTLNIKTTNGTFRADNIVVAAGGKAQKNLGSNGSGYKLLASLGHTITPLSPALVQLTSPSKYPRKLKGHRVRCALSIFINDEEISRESGEVLFTDYGISGIVTMNLSQAVGKCFLNNNAPKCSAVLDLVPDYTELRLKEHIDKFGSLEGILGTELSQIICAQSGSSSERSAHIAKNWRLIINGTKGFDFAQITSGGASLDEFDGYKSKLIEGLYACGEVLDVQYCCGGYNLNHAFYSGIKTADSIAGKYR